MSQSSTATVSPPSHADSRSEIMDRFRDVRARTEELAAHLPPEDQVVQSMEDASPVKWHLAHTTWFFEQFLLVPTLTGYRVFDPDYAFLFNSYYEAMGARHARPRRGMLTRPTVSEVAHFRSHVTAGLIEMADSCDDRTWSELAPLIELGCSHEQQHQELLLTDLLHAFSCNPLKPAYHPYRPAPATQPASLRWIDFEGGIREIGHDGSGFAFDCEGPRHRVLLEPYRLASHPVTNGEWKAFVEDDAYNRPELWLSDGWAAVQREGWQAPIYWEKRDSDWWSMTLSGMQKLEDDAPVTQVSFYEAEAYARWAGRRLPTEAEWEVASETVALTGNTAGTGFLRPTVAEASEDGLSQMCGDVWEWTQTPYAPYPGFRPPPGAVGEYNGKFMCNQMVLRGGSCVTPDDHLRRTYRNFFYPHQRWQFSGLRLADDG